MLELLKNELKVMEALFIDHDRVDGAGINLALSRLKPPRSASVSAMGPGSKGGVARLLYQLNLRAQPGPIVVVQGQQKRCLELLRRHTTPNIPPWAPLVNSFELGTALKRTANCGGSGRRKGE